MAASGTALARCPEERGPGRDVWKWIATVLGGVVVGMLLHGSAVTRQDVQEMMANDPKTAVMQETIANIRDTQLKQAQELVEMRKALTDINLSLAHRR